jgi:SecD/SecF fusion protein
MKRTFLTRTIICLIPTLLATALVVNAYLKDPKGLSGFKRGIDLSGGTILVYEIDQDASKLSRGPGVAGPDRAEADQAMAEAIKRRIDPADLLGVIVRPAAGKTRVEIILPYGVRAGDDKAGAGESDVEKIKSLIQEVGSLEFRILANNDDDAQAIADASAYMDRAAADVASFADAKIEPQTPEGKELLRAALDGVPPPFTNKAPGDPDEYMVGAAEQSPTPVQYAWVELGKNERADLGISSTRPGPGRNGVELAPLFESARTTNRVVRHGSNVYWSRPSRSLKKPAESAEKKFDYFVLTRVSDRDRLQVGGDVTINAFIDTGKTAEPVIGFAFNSRGAEKFYQMTSRNKPTGPEGAPKTFRQLGIILDGHLISSANINEAIRDRGQISGNFERSYVERIVNLLRSGALPATLKPLPVSENKIAATLGADTVRNGTLSVVLAFAAVLAFMIVYYRFAGLVATVALLANLLLTIGFMQAVNATFTLPGMAGLVLMLGMAVDANVLIYERVREERDRGMNLATALRNGYDRAFPTIIDTHLSSIFTAIVLYAVGNDQLKGFGVSLTVGLVISLFTSLYMTRLIFDYWQHRGWLTQLRMMRLFSRPNLKFMNLRYYMFTLTGLLTVGGLALFLLRGEKGLNVDFVGGTAYSGRLVKKLEIGELRDLLSDKRQQARLNVTRVDEIGDVSGKTKYTYRINYDDQQSNIVALANAPEGNTPEARQENVRQRASVLRDWSVEQIFPGGSTENVSDQFTVRTTERERELVEAAISRLFVDDQGNDLLVKNEITGATPVPATDDYMLSFKEPVSRSTIKTLFERQLQAKLGDQYPAADVFDVLEPENEKPIEGRYSTLRLRIIKDANEGIRNLIAAKQLPEVIEAAKKEFATRPQPERLETFDGTLASETRTRALYAILASWLAILLYLWFRFGNWTFGAAAVICLIHDLAFTLGCIALCHYIHDTTVGQLLGLKDFKIDLPAIAALLTLVGYSVNDTIVVFDRIKEVRGKNPVLTPQMIDDSVNQTLSRTVLAALTVFLVVIVLYIFGGDTLHLFAFVMVVGVVVGTYSSIYVASPLLLLFGEGRVKHRVGEPATAPA